MCGPKKRLLPAIERTRTGVWGGVFRYNAYGDKRRRRTYLPRHAYNRLSLFFSVRYRPFGYFFIYATGRSWWWWWWRTETRTRDENETTAADTHHVAAVPNVRWLRPDGVRLPPPLPSRTSIYGRFGRPLIIYSPLPPDRPTSFSRQTVKPNRRFRSATGRRALSFRNCSHYTALRRKTPEADIRVTTTTTFRNSRTFFAIFVVAQWPSKPLP